MRNAILFVLVLLVAASVFAGEGKSCDRNHAAKNVQLTGTIQDGGEGGRVFRVADSTESYTICDKSTAELTKLNGSKVRVSGKLVSCGEGQELMIEKAAQI